MAKTKSKPKAKAKGTKSKPKTKRVARIAQVPVRLTKYQQEVFKSELYRNKERTMKSLAFITGILAVFGTFYWINSQFGPTATAITGATVVILILFFAHALLLESTRRSGVAAHVEGMKDTLAVLTANAQVDRYRAATEHEHAKMQRITHEFNARQTMQDEKLLEQAIQNRVKLLGVGQNSTAKHWESVDNGIEVETWNDE